MNNETGSIEWAHTYHRGRLEHCLVGELVHDVELEVIALTTQGATSLTTDSTKSENKTYGVARNERARELAIHEDGSTGVAIRRDVPIGDGQVRDGSNGSEGGRERETQRREQCKGRHIDDDAI